MPHRLQNGLLYTTEEIERMTQAFNGAWDILVQSGSIHARPYKADSTREQLALKIIELVRVTANDAEVLQKEALDQLDFTPRPLLPVSEITIVPSEHP